jgi:hypothetical protein
MHLKVTLYVRCLSSYMTKDILKTACNLNPAPFHTPRSALGLMPPLIQWERGNLSPGANRPGHEAKQ